MVHCSLLSSLPFFPRYVSIDCCWRFEITIIILLVYKGCCNCACVCAHVCIYSTFLHMCVCVICTELPLIFCACAARQSIMHKGQHQSRDAKFWSEAISSFEASIETNVCSNVLAKHYTAHSWVCSLYKSKIYSKDFTGCANNPPYGCRTEEIHAHTSSWWYNFVDKSVTCYHR